MANEQPMEQNLSELVRNALAGRPLPAIKRDLRAMLALELKQLGWNHHEIARYFGIKPKAVARLLEQGKQLFLLLMSGIIEQRNNDIHRIEIGLREWFPRAIQGDPDAMEIVIKLLRLKGMFLRYNEIREEDSSAEIWRRIAQYAHQPKTAKVITLPRALPTKEADDGNETENE